MLKQLFGPLDKKYCIYFSLLSISGFLFGIFLILFLIVYISIIKQRILIIHLIIISFIIYFQNRLLFNMCINEKNTIENFGKRNKRGSNKIVKGCHQPLNIKQWHFLMKSLFGHFHLITQRMQGSTGPYKCNLPSSCPVPTEKPFCLSTGAWACDTMPLSRFGYKQKIYE